MYNVEENFYETLYKFFLQLKNFLTTIDVTFLPFAGVTDDLEQLEFATPEIEISSG